MKAEEVSRMALSALRNPHLNPVRVRQCEANPSPGSMKLRFKSSLTGKLLRCSGLRVWLNSAVLTSGTNWGTDFARPLPFWPI